jgi:transcriptional regulator with XRE-family HTH domain
MSPDLIIRNARHEAGLTQAELALRLGTTQSAIARLERPGSNPTVATLQSTLAAAGHRLDLDSHAGLPEVDEGQIRERLRLTPAERLASFQRSHRNMTSFLANVRRVEPAD